MPHEPGPLWPFPDGTVRVENAPGTKSITLGVGTATAELSVADARAVAVRLVETAAAADAQDDTANAESRRIPMQFLLLAAEQVVESGTPETCDVGCWIADQTRTNAFHIAFGWVSGNGWEVLEVLEHHPVTRADYAGDEDHLLPYYEQAITDGEVFLYEIDDPNEEPENAA